MTYFNWLYGVATGGRILGVEVPKEQIYAAKFKGIAVCFSLLKVFQINF